MIKNRFYFLSLFSILLFLSCSSGADNVMDEESKDLMDIKEPDVEQLGSINGTIKLIDQHTNESFEYQGTKIKLLQDDSIIDQLSMNTDSTYAFSDLKIGEYTMVVEKEGYGSYDTLRIENTIENNKLSQLELLEFPKVNVDLFLVEYKDGFLYREIIPCFESSQRVTIRYEYYFSKDSDVSYLNYDLFFPAGGKSWNNIPGRPCEEITIPGRSGTSYDFSNFTDAGFEVGDKVYVKIYPVHEFFFGTVHQDYKEKNFEILRHIRANGSNTIEFIL